MFENLFQMCLCTYKVEYSSLLSVSFLQGTVELAFHANVAGFRVWWLEILCKSD